MSTFLNSFTKGFDSKAWFRRAYLVGIMVLTFRLTSWGMSFADRGLLEKADLLGLAAVLAAVGALPVGILALIQKHYQEHRNGPSNPLS